jgi:hypothetical protein
MNKSTLSTIQHSFFIILAITLALGILPAGRIQPAQAAPASPSIHAAGTKQSIYLLIIINRYGPLPIVCPY